MQFTHNNKTYDVLSTIDPLTKEQLNTMVIFEIKPSHIEYVSHFYGKTSDEQKIIKIACQFIDSIEKSR